MCPKDLNAPMRAHYLIVLRNCVVLQDLADTIAEFDADAQVIAVTDPAGAIDVLAQVERLAVAFIEAAPAVFAKTELAVAIALRGGRVVFLGGAAEDAEQFGHSIVLRRPFSSEVVLNHLATLVPR